MIQVFIADDHAIMRAGLREILESVSDIKVVAEAEDGQQVLTQLDDFNWDILLLDLTMPGVNGIDLIKRVKVKRPNARILVLSMHNEDQFAVRSLRAGASGYLTKDSAPDLLLSAIRRVANGGKHISRALTEKLAFDLDPFKESSGHDRLSDREFEVLRLIVSGKSITEIATELMLSVKTVSTHKRRMMQKLNIKNNVELIQYSLNNNLFG